MTIQCPKLMIQIGYYYLGEGDRLLMVKYVLSTSPSDFVMTALTFDLLFLRVIIFAKCNRFPIIVL